MTDEARIAGRAGCAPGWDWAFARTSQSAYVPASEYGARSANNDGIRAVWIAERGGHKRERIDTVFVARQIT